MMLPVYTRAVWTHVGTIVDDESALFFDPRHEYFMSPEMFRNKDWYIEDGDGDAAVRHLGRAYQRYRSGSRESFAESALGRQVGEELDASRAPLPMAFVGGFFEGNHGDDNLFLILDGPLADHLICYENMFHGGGALHFVGHVTDWLYESYFLALECELPGEEEFASNDVSMVGLYIS